MLVLDKENDNITVFKRTSYGDELVEVLKLQRDRQYDKAAEHWENILQRNSNFDMSYIGIGSEPCKPGKSIKKLWLLTVRLRYRTLFGSLSARPQGMG